MRWGLALLALCLGLFAEPAGSESHGRDLWQIRLGPGLHGRWVLLDVGRARFRGESTPLLLLGLVRADRPAGRYYEMTVVDGRDGSTLWTYDGTGSDYVAASAPEVMGPRDDEGLARTRPRLCDVDGDDSDDVVFVEQDFVFGTLLRAVQVTP